MSVTHPDQIHDAFIEAINAKDVDALLDLYEADGVAVELDGSVATGRDAVLTMLDGLTSAIRHMDGTTRKVFVAGDVALSSASWTAQIVLPDGTVTTEQGTTAEVTRRQPDGTWKFVLDDPMFV